MKRFLAVIGLAMPALAQYAGPAILSRGDAPSAMNGPSIRFRPFVEVSGVYDTGLAGVAVNSQGQLANDSSEGLRVGWGISGSHNWRHTQIGLEYHGDVNYYFGTTYYDSIDQTMMLGVKHQFTRHVTLNLENSAGTYSRNNGFLGLQQTVPFDPQQLVIPTTDFFDNRTIYLNTIADLIIQRSARLSIDIGGGGFETRRRSTALYGVAGGMARADVQYRLTRRSTIGADYSYTHYSFNHIFSSTDLHGISGTYAIQISRTVEFSGYAGAMRAETKFIQSVPLDPAIAAILGIGTGFRVTYSVRYIPNLSGRLSRTLPNGVVFLSGGHTVTPGNGLFLTSTVTEASAGYTYTGLRRWSMNIGAAYNKASSIGNVIGNYGGYTGTMSASRQLLRNVHLVATVSARKYESADFSQYNRVFYTATLGLGFAPGDVPIRIW